MAAAVLVVLAVLSSRSAGQSSADSRYVPGEIIVKLRALAENEPDTDLDRDKLSIDNGLGERRLREVRSLGKHFQQQQGRPQGPRDGRRGPATLDERRLLQHRPQAPKGSAGAGLRRIYRIRVDAEDEAATQEALARLRSHPDVEYAERNRIISACAWPNDPLYSLQWALAKIDAAGAWDLSQGAEDIVVAVPDTGVDYNHRDLQGNLWFNEAELNGVEGADDDENGYIDDIRGYNFIDANNDPMDDNGHGTHCAGIIAARTGNGLDIAGVCWNVRVMPLKMLDDEGYGPTSAAVEAIYYAVANGADIISCSWGDTADSQALREAVAYAYGQGVVLVAAAGNERSSEPFYPAACPEVIGVAATDQDDRRQFASSFGDWVDIAAPGDNILSLRAAGTSSGAVWNAYTTRLSGTSMAAPHISGACALLLSIDPCFGPDGVRELLLATADPIAEGTCPSNGRLNVAAALQAVVPLRGEVGFDREVYREGSDVLIRLVDRHLQGAGTQTVLVTTEAGDLETVTLTETSFSSGVFSAVLGSEAGPAIPQDGRIQAMDGHWVRVDYLDADDGEGRTNQMVTSQARFDYTPPTAMSVEVEPRGSFVRVTLMTNEPARVDVRYRAAGYRAAWMSVHDPAYKHRHRVNLGPLVRGLDYKLVITLTEAAGNETILEHDDQGRPFSVRLDPDALLVPGMFRTIQAAIDAARPGDTIWVADGTYSGSGNRRIDFGGKAIAVRSENGPQACIINLRGRNYAVVFRSGEGADSVLDGFTITAGGGSDFGGAIYCLSSSPTITNCILTNNAADRRGGAIYCLLSSPTIEACTFVGNTAEERGGALYCDAGSYPHVVRCTFEGNRADAGGAVSIAADSAPIFQQCLFFNNMAASYGAAMACFDTALTLANCTIARNEAGLSGGGLWCDEAGSLRLDNCILWDNIDSRDTAVESAQVVADPAQVEINYSCVQGWTGTFGGVGSFGLDPLFADPENGNFHLRSQGGRWDSAQARWVYDTVTSPCIDAGDPAWPLGDEPVTPSDGTAGAQTLNTRINMGAYGGTAEAGFPFLH